jgi:DNA repair protein RecO (recombination protein O)
VPVKDTEAIVLRSQPLGESDRIVTFLTRAVGKLRGVAKGARRSVRRFGSNLEPLSRVRLTYFETEGRDLTRVESADLLESFYRIQEDPERAAVLACFAEVADAFAREQQEDDASYRLLHAVLRAVRDGVDLEVAARYFEIWTLRLHGVLPDLTACGRCGAALGAADGTCDRRESVIVCGDCAAGAARGTVPVPAAARRAALEMLRRGPETFAGEPRPEGLPALGQLAQVIFVDVTETTFRSYRVLQALRGRAPAEGIGCR